MNRLFNTALISVRLTLISAVLLCSGCASLVSNAASNFADNLSAAVANQDDPETVRDGAPAYLLLLDSLVEGSPDNSQMLAAAANMYASYGAVFADDPIRASRLTARASNYASRAICIDFKPSCSWPGMSFNDYQNTLAGLSSKNADVVYAYGLSSLAYIRAHASDFNALAKLPNTEALLTRYLDISDDDSDASVYVYLGILATLRPPALGGEPEKGQAAFEHAIQLTDGKDLSAKVEYARGYARLMYDRELHDRLLIEVMESDVEVSGYTLTNVMAQDDAVILLATADDYF